MTGLSVVAEQPVVHRLHAFDVRFGGSVTIEVQGSNLDGARELWTPGFRIPLANDWPATKSEAVFHGLLPESVSAGIHFARIVTDRGVSTAVPVVVDDLPQTVVVPSHDSDQPAVLPIPCCFFLPLVAGKPQFVAIDLQAGQPISVDAFARRLHSACDPVLRLTDPEGRETAWSDDVPGLLGDAQLSGTANISGRHVLELRDVRYLGGPRYSMHVRVGESQLTQGAFPRLVADSVRPVFIAAAPVAANCITDDAVYRYLWQESRLSKCGSFAAAQRSERIQQLEVEPNGSRETATPVNIATRLLSGRLSEPGDQDWFRLTGQAKQLLCVTAVTRETQSPADVVLQLLDYEGSVVKAVDDLPPRDAQLSASFPADGEYFLCVEERSSHGGPAWTWDLLIDMGGRIEFTSATDYIVVPANGTGHFDLQMRRVGAAGPVRVAVTELPDGLKSDPIYVAENQKNVRLTITGAQNTVAPAAPIRLSCLHGDNEPQTVTYLTPFLKDNADLRRRYCGFVFCVTGIPAGFEITPMQQRLRIVPGCSAEVALRIIRQKGWEEAIGLEPVFPKELPPGVSLGSEEVSGDSSNLRISVEGNSVPGRYSLFLQGKIKHGGKEVVQPVPVLTIQIARSPQESAEPVE